MSKKVLSKRLTKHLKPEEIRANALIFEVVNTIIEENLLALAKKIHSEETYEKPAWSEYIADKLGASRELTNLSNIFKVE